MQGYDHCGEDNTTVDQIEILGKKGRDKLHWEKHNTTAGNRSGTQLRKKFTESFPGK